MSPMTGITTWTRVHLVMIVPRQTIIYSLKAKEVLGFSNPDLQRLPRTPRFHPLRHIHIAPFDGKPKLKLDSKNLGAPDLSAPLN